jgi:16S rRNA (uracil1498-N3)-methyltransferase
VERGPDATVATFFTEEPPEAGAAIALGEAAARHAAVRRLSEGAAVAATDGRGRKARGTIRRLTKRELVVDVRDVEQVAPSPVLELLVPVADRDRMLWLAEKCTELGFSVWQPVLFARSRSVTPRGDGAPFAAKVRARMISALEQSGNAWLPEVRPAVPLARATAMVAAPTRYLLDRLGERIDASVARRGVAVMFGPEGGLETEERELALASGWTPVRLGSSTLRFETAGVAAVSILRAAAPWSNGDD